MNLGNTERPLRIGIACYPTHGGSGVLAFTEAPGSDGWRIRYYSFWLWVDGPGDGFTGANNRTDIQGIACHEYGHALGMGHSVAGGNPTMSAFVWSSSVMATSSEAR